MISPPVYELGNTIRLTAQFSDWSNNPVIPGSVKIKFYEVKLNVYSEEYKKINEYPINNITENTSTFYFDYVLDREGLICYEWYAEIDGLPSLQRELIQVKMARKTK